MPTDEQKQKVLQEIDPYVVSPKSLHLEMPLYHVLDLSIGMLAETVFELLTHSGTVDAHCLWCEKESVFETKQPLKLGDYPYLHHWKSHGDGFFRIIHRCSRNEDHQYYAYYLKNGDVFVKIGQWPSAADSQIPQAEKYRKILGNEQYKEFTKGIGLAAHGVGIGSFVYLRRVFEKLIEEARIKSKAEDKNFSEELYSKARMDEKIKIVKDCLPAFLVENRVLYAIMSKGIHELGEDECLKYFETVKIGIEQILDEKIIQKEKAEKAVRAREAIKKTVGELTNS